jgi:hypothetical protein
LYQGIDFLTSLLTTEEIGSVGRDIVSRQGIWW